MKIEYHEEGIVVDSIVLKWDQLPVLEKKMRLLAYSELTSGGFSCYGIGVKVLGRWQYQVNDHLMSAQKLFETASQLTVYRDIHGQPFCILRTRAKNEVPMRRQEVHKKKNIFVPMPEIDHA